MDDALSSDALGCVPWRGLRTLALRLSSPVEVAGSFRGDCRRTVFMMGIDTLSRWPEQAAAGTVGV